MTCNLYYGPGARQAAMDEARTRGRMLAPPFGDDGGLKVKEARQLVLLLSETLVNEEIGVIVAGPMDQATTDASDALLMSIEEYDPRYVQPVLWADDVGGVLPTLRSRCEERWIASLGEEEDEAMVSTAWDLIDSALANQLALIPMVVAEYEGKEHALLGALAGALALASPMTPGHLALWERIRKVSRYRNPRHFEITCALLPEVSG